MGMAVGGGGGGGKRRRGMAEINVTPLVDVMLVLLVIFMITAPTMKEGFSVGIPEADATQQVPIEDARLVTVTQEGYVLRAKADTVEQRYEKLSELVDDLKKYKQETLEAQRQPLVVIVGDRNARYERIIQVWNAARNAGVAQVSFQVDPGVAPDQIVPAP